MQHRWTSVTTYIYINCRQLDLLKFGNAFLQLPAAAFSPSPSPHLLPVVSLVWWVYCATLFWCPAAFSRCFFYYDIMHGRWSKLLLSIEGVTWTLLVPENDIILYHSCTLTAFSILDFVKRFIPGCKIVSFTIPVLDEGENFTFDDTLIIELARVPFNNFTEK